MSHTHKQSTCDESRHVGCESLHKGRDDDDSQTELDTESTTEVFRKSWGNEETSDDAADRVGYTLQLSSGCSKCIGILTGIDCSDDVGVDLCVSIFLEVVYECRISLNGVEGRGVVAIDRLYPISPNTIGTRLAIVRAAAPDDSHDVTSYECIVPELLR